MQIVYKNEERVIRSGRVGGPSQGRLNNKGLNKQLSTSVTVSRQ